MTRKQIAERLAKMKAGDSFTVASSQERTAVNQIASALRDGGLIQVNITTRKTDGNGFTVIAVAKEEK